MNMIELNRSLVQVRLGDRLLHHGHVLKCGPRSWRTKGSGPEESK